MAHPRSTTQAENPGCPKNPLADVLSSLEERKSKRSVHKFARKLIEKTGMGNNEIDIAAGRKCSEMS